jgi:predicted amidohydrolase
VSSREVDSTHPVARARSVAAAQTIPIPGDVAANVLANYGGPTGGLPAAGGSGIWSDAGEPLVQLGAKGAGIAVATTDEAGWRTRAVLL